MKRAWRWEIRSDDRTVYHVTLVVGDCVGTARVSRALTVERLRIALEQFEQGIPDGVAFWTVEWKRAA